MRRNLITACLFLLPLTSFAKAQDEDFREKLRQLEQRIAVLEKNQKPGDQDKASEDHQAGPDEAASQTVEVEELRRQVDILADELERLRSGEEAREVTSQEAQNRGLSKSAASVYGKSKGVSIAGYGEMLYENFDRADESGNIVDKSARLDFLRAILYAGYRFNDRFLFNSEIEFEHSSTDKSGSVSVEFAYLDFLIDENLSLRGGLLLIPMGLINEFHEPNFFLGALRPQTEKVIIPTTWRENGFGIVGSYGPLSFRSYLVNGLNASGFSSSGLRGGRQKGSQAYATDMAWVTRVDVEPTPGLLLGTSLYTGGSGQGLVRIEDQDFRVRNTIWDIHGTFRSRGWTIAGLFADSSVGDTEELNQFLNTNPDSPVASRLRGGYIQAGYNVLNRHHESVSLSPYYRFERVNTQKKLPLGYQPDPGKIGWFHTFGFELKPISSIVLKTDYQWSRNEKSTGLNQFNIVLGYAF
jgi:hypothetical protein